MQQSRRWSYISAAVLALVTLGVFYVLQYYGPESAVRRFHAVGINSADSQVVPRIFNWTFLDSRQRSELERITVGPIDTEDVASLMDFITLNLVVGKGSYEIARIDYQRSDQVTVAVG